MGGFTTYADRVEMVKLHQRGYSYPEIARWTGWRYETVRQVCRRYKREGESALQPGRLGRPPTGVLGTFDPKVRFAVLKLKCQHPGWGPDVIRAELAKRAWVQDRLLPSGSQIGAYLRQFGERLVRKQAHKRMSKAQPSLPAAAIVHGCWQLDADERIELPGYGKAHILNLVDHKSGIKIAARLFPAYRQGARCRIAWPQYRQALRDAFTRWGLSEGIRTDRDKVIVSTSDYPFPMPFTLWLVGLGIEHELIRRVTQNGMVERSHQTWQGRLCGYGPSATLPAWQEVVDYECWRMNAILPSRGRHCQRQPPLTVYPEARIPHRIYREPDELALFALERVEDYLAQGEWLRLSSRQGQVSLNNQHFGLGLRYRNRWVRITYQPHLGFQATCPPDVLPVLTFQLNGLSVADLTGLAPSLPP